MVKYLQTMQHNYHLGFVLGLIGMMLLVNLSVDGENN